MNGEWVEAKQWDAQIYQGGAFYRPTDHNPADPIPYAAIGRLLGDTPAWVAWYHTREGWARLEQAFSDVEEAKAVALAAWRMQ